MPELGVRIDGLAEARKTLGHIEHQIGVWSRAQIGMVSEEPYTHWIEEGFYFSGRPGRTTAYHMLAQAADAIVPMIARGIAESLADGGPEASRTAEALSDRLVSYARGFAPEVTGRLRAGMRPLRAGKIFPV